MPSKKKQGKKRKPLSGLRLYTRILQEVNNQNNSLPDKQQISAEKRRQLVSKKLYPAFKETKPRDLRIGDIKESVTNFFKSKTQTTRRPLKGLHLYNRLLQEAIKINKALPNEQQITPEKLRQIISTELYPVYKEKRIRDIRIADIKKSVAKSFRDISSDSITNPLFISPEYLAFIDFFSIDDVLKKLVPDCIDVRVQGGKTGNTKIFNTKKYSYYGDGVRQIVENIRKEIKNDYTKAYFTGYKKLKDGRKDNLKADNYFLDFILYIKEKEVANSDDAISVMPKEIKHRQRKVSNTINKRIKELEKEDRRKKSERNKVKNSAAIVQQQKRKEANKKRQLLQKKREEKTKKETAKIKKSLRQTTSAKNLAIKSALQILESAYKKDAVTKAYYDREKKKLLKLKNKR